MDFFDFGFWIKDFWVLILISLTRGGHDLVDASGLGWNFLQGRWQVTFFLACILPFPRFQEKCGESASPPEWDEETGL